MAKTKPQAPVQLVWFKRDLRLSDHRPLVEASRRGPVLCLYIYEPELLAADDFDPSHLAFANEGLRELAQGLAACGVPLHLRHGEAVSVLQALHRQYPIAAVWSHRETGGHLSYQRDLRTKAWLESAGIPWHEFPQDGVIRRLKDRQGWARRWEQRMREAVLPPPTHLTGPCLAPEAVRPPAELGLAPCRRPDRQRGGESVAQQTLQSFLTARGVHYRKDMSSPLAGWQGCSRISPYLAWGQISMKQVYQRTTLRQAQLKAARAARQAVQPGWAQSLRSFQSRLHWHCHFMQKLEDEPAIEFENMCRGFDGLREDSFCPDKFAAFCAGQTGYPMVDACMRALHQTGWINFRMRAMLVSFASYHLWLHWRPTALYLAQQFVDFEPGIHYSQVQMQSGVTGINAIRIYSPAKQARDQDPDGHFIRRYLPELEAVPLTHLAAPQTMSASLQAECGVRIGKDYPAPIVDPAQAYFAARTRMAAARRRPEVRALAEAVYARHGSRAGPTRPRRRRTASAAT